MPSKNCLTNPDGSIITYTCRNRRYQTNIYKGNTHAPFSSIRGNFFNQTLIETGGVTLWLEHVIAVDSHEELYWFMWYDSNGIPTIPLSGVFSINEFEKMKLLLKEPIS